jgi:hypothetical protein
VAFSFSDLQTVLSQLKREGIRLGTNKGRLANPDNRAIWLFQERRATRAEQSRIENLPDHRSAPQQFENVVS